jgi:predicted hydrocarbon binding protein
MRCAGSGQEPPEGLSRDLERGWIMEGGERIITFRIKTFQAFVERLSGILGPRAAGVLLYEMGMEIGQVSFQYSKASIGSDADLSRAFDSVLRLRGWGRIVRFERREGGGRAVYKVSIEGSPMAHERRAEGPTCDLLRGVAAGWLSAYLGKRPAASAETECASAGGRACSFEMAFRD